MNGCAMALVGEGLDALALEAPLRAIAEWTALTLGETGAAAKVDSLPPS